MSKWRIGKKAMAMGMCLCMLLGSAVGFAEEGKDTNALESALKSLMASESMTIDAQYIIRQNGEDMITGDVLYQTGGDRQYARANATHQGGEMQDMEWCKADGTQVVRIGDDFYAIPVDTDEEAVEVEATSDEEDDIESTEKTTMDYLMTVLGQLFGSASNSLTLSDTGLALHMSGDEVPAVLNLVVSTASGTMIDTPETKDEAEATSGILYGTRGEVTELKEEKPTMTMGTNLYIDRIDLDMAVEGQSLSGIQCSIILVGKDVQGERLETEIAAVIRFVDLGTTEPGAIDMTGVEMKPLEESNAKFLNFIK